MQRNKCAMSKMLGSFDEKGLYASVIAIAKAHDKGHTSTVRCLKIRDSWSDRNYEELIPIFGTPFPLYNKDRLYIWQNSNLRDNGIEVGSIVEVDEHGSFMKNTGKKMEVDEILNQLKFDDHHHAIAHRGIAEAFPYAEIAATKGIFQNGSRPSLPHALISVKTAVTGDDRIYAITRLEETINLNNRSRGKFKQSTLEELLLPVNEPTSEDDVGDVILVSFGMRRTSQDNYQAICEAILLRSQPCELTHYQMISQPRGICLILNNICFQGDNEDRYGGEVDEQSLGELFQDELHFDLQVRHDLQYYKMQQACEEIAGMRHSAYDAFVCIIMSHGGDRDTVFGVRGKKIAIEDLTSEFYPKKCPALAGKPKVFIIQTCRGPNEDKTILSPGASVDSVTGLSTDSTVCRSVCPQQTDFLFAFSTVPGYVSRRDKTNGSLFIKTLVDVIRRDHKKEHLGDMLTTVTRIVANKGGQVPAPVSTLRYKLYL